MIWKYQKNSLNSTSIFIAHSLKTFKEIFTGLSYYPLNYRDFMLKEEIEKLIGNLMSITVATDRKNFIKAINKPQFIETIIFAFTTEQDFIETYLHYIAQRDNIIRQLKEIAHLACASEEARTDFKNQDRNKLLNEFESKEELTDFLNLKYAEVRRNRLKNRAFTYFGAGALNLFFKVIDRESIQLKLLILMGLFIVSLIKGEDIYEEYTHSKLIEKIEQSYSKLVSLVSIPRFNSVQQLKSIQQRKLILNTVCEAFAEVEVEKIGRKEFLPLSKSLALLETSALNGDEVQEARGNVNAEAALVAQDCNSLYTPLLKLTKFVMEGINHILALERAMIPSHASDKSKGFFTQKKHIPALPENSWVPVSKIT